MGLAAGISFESNSSFLFERDLWTNGKPFVRENRFPLFRIMLLRPASAFEDGPGTGHPRTVSSERGDRRVLDAS
ncbi:hypothetical protein, partial [Mesorhizobium sp. M7A.F.Ca.CA.004.06.1.1]|uniref:hypothetical protein n=1 Tax=Mesorhizobium sp. M7A.F.Ca.CA.004.06.1.1 TaxID=2496686 RepID=UPI0019CF8C29